jgi:DNA-binding GntR family transcriptional regulator
MMMMMTTNSPFPQSGTHKPSVGLPANASGFQLLGGATATATTANKASTAPLSPAKGSVMKGGRLLEGFDSPTEQRTNLSKPTSAQAFDFISSTDATSKVKPQSFSAGFVRLGKKHLPRKKPDFQQAGASKDMLIAAWLTNWIQTGLTKGTLTENNLLPLKQDLATYLGVSVGTVQNAIRYVEDDGLVESKQRIGTLIRQLQSADNLTTHQGGNTNGESRVRKQTSKRDTAVVALQQYFIKAGYEVGQPLPASRELAKVIGSAPNTTRLALEFLTVQGVLSSNNARDKKANWVMQQLPNLEENQLGQQMVVQTDTLIDQVERELKELIAEDYEVNAKLPSHLELAESLKVSIKTVHDAMQRLVIQGYVHSKRGRYGTFVSRIPSNLINVSAVEQFFVPAEEHQETAQPVVADVTFYHYQRAEKQLRALIKTEYQVGQHCAPIPELATILGVSTNSVRRALQALAAEGLVSFKRGRFGGTIVEAIPQ